MKTTSESSEFLHSAQNEMVQLLEELISLPTHFGSHDGTISAHDLLGKKLEALGFVLERIDYEDGYGTHLVARSSSSQQSGKSGILLCGHIDTVLSLEDWQRAKTTGMTGDLLYGPGAYDMKAGLVQIYYTLLTLNHIGALADAEITVVITNDEERGSPSSGNLLAALGESASHAVIFEFGRAENQVVTQRKARETWELTLHGKAAHAGNHLLDGVNAILGLGPILTALSEIQLREHARGVTINPGKIEGGSDGLNLVPDRAQLAIEVRAKDVSQLRTLEEELRGLANSSSSEELRIELTQRSSYPAMLPSKNNAPLLSKYFEAAKQAGFSSSEAELVGGGSQGNFLPAELPKIDGVGPAGAGAHTLDEYVDLQTLIPKTLATSLLIKDLFTLSRES